ncbi:PPC domain-containing DNA-binding protein [Desulfatitalea alkaliphila]|uniref:DNA-binding protein n=1 Tax=Desulfatitalea alkaliphila TaxID=2929485 RepID=A0AA41QZ94_9BACT|nr:PPC domain-containing DNA-binding protein [Desulfatitalea alkaliphila]MCJ8499084.1 DNA-binding protein [Desulfatitalea alkaliphila]
MKFSQARQGRVFVLRLEDGEIVHEVIEQFAREQAVKAAALLILGGADDGSRLVVGPREGRALPIEPMEHLLQGTHEVTGTGTLFPDAQGAPLLHMHMACGRQGKSVTGCVRQGVKVWHIMEVIVFELLDTTARRTPQPPMGWPFLEP